MQIHDIRTLEHLTDEEFWDLAFASAFPTVTASSAHTSTASLPPESSRSLIHEAYIRCDALYAFPLVALHEILPMQQHTTPLPGSPDWMLGLVAWRGHILATIDLRAYLSVDATLTQDPVLLIAHHNQDLRAFVASVTPTTSLEDDASTVLNVADLFHDITRCLEKKPTNE